MDGCTAQGRSAVCAELWSYKAGDSTQPVYDSLTWTRYLAGDSTLRPRQVIRPNFILTYSRTEHIDQACGVMPTSDCTESTRVTWSGLTINFSFWNKIGHSSMWTFPFTSSNLPAPKHPRHTWHWLFFLPRDSAMIFCSCPSMLPSCPATVPCLWIDSFKFTRSRWSTTKQE